MPDTVRYLDTCPNCGIEKQRRKRDLGKLCKPCSMSLIGKKHGENRRLNSIAKTPAEYSKITREKNKNNNSYRLRKLLEGARVRAKRYGVVCDLTLDDLLDIYPKDNMCPVLHIPLFWGSSGKGNRNNSPSLDRIDPKGNYSKDNICIISWRANMLKSDATLEEIEAIYFYLKQ